MSDPQPSTLPAATAALPADVSSRLDEVVKSLVFIRPEVLGDDVDLIGDLGYDSLGLLELITAIEHEFDVDEVNEADALSVITVGDLRRLLAESLR